MVSFLLCFVLYKIKKLLEESDGLHSNGCTWSLLVISAISGAGTPKDYSLFYPGQNKSGRRTVTISVEKNAQSSKSRKNKNCKLDV